MRRRVEAGGDRFLPQGHAGNLYRLRIAGLWMGGEVGQIDLGYGFLIVTDGEGSPGQVRAREAEGGQERRVHLRQEPRTSRRAVPRVPLAGQ